MGFISTRAISTNDNSIRRSQNHPEYWSDPIIEEIEPCDARQSSTTYHIPHSAAE